MRLTEQVTDLVDHDRQQVHASIGITTFDRAQAAIRILDVLLVCIRGFVDEPAMARRIAIDVNGVTIDAAKTQDIDDALYAEISSDGCTLFVAIADPSAYIDAGSGLHRDVAMRGTSVYFHGDVLPMLPEELSQDTCALSEGGDRPALACKVAIRESGKACAL